jgi:hypothetical protein
MIRSLCRNWKLNAVAVFSLAIAMALSVIALSVSNAFLLRPPFGRDADRLVTLYTVAGNTARENFSYPDYQYVRDNNRAFSGVAALDTAVTRTRSVMVATMSLRRQGLSRTTISR